LEDTNIALTDSINTWNGEYTFYKKKVKDHDEGGWYYLDSTWPFELDPPTCLAEPVGQELGHEPQKIYIRISRSPNAIQLADFKFPEKAYPQRFPPRIQGWSWSLPWMAFGMDGTYSTAYFDIITMQLPDEKWSSPFLSRPSGKPTDVQKEFDTETIN